MTDWTDWSPLPTCPHCGYADDEYTEYMDRECFDTECGDCGEEFTVCHMVDIEFRTRKIQEQTND